MNCSGIDLCSLDHNEERDDRAADEPWTSRAAADIEVPLEDVPAAVEKLQALVKANKAFDGVQAEV